MEGSFTAMMRESADRLVSFRQARLEEHGRSLEERREAIRTRRGQAREAATRCRRWLGRIHSENRRRAEEEAEQRRITASDLRAGTHNLLDMIRMGIRRQQDDIRQGLECSRSLRTGSHQVPASEAQPSRGADQNTGHAKPRSGGKARK